MDLPASGLVVVTGASGAGKSTLLRAMAGELTPLCGSIRADGVDVYAVGYEELVTQVTLVEQDSQLLSGTVGENLRLARPQARDDELQDALDVAALTGAVCLAAVIGPRGEGLSGGQARRLAVAQAYLRRLRLLLLDEPTEGIGGDRPGTGGSCYRGALATIP